MQQHAWSKKLKRAESLTSCSSGVIMQKSQKNAGFNTAFYNPSKSAKEIHSGYLTKSPPCKKFKSEKSWKKRYFVLFKISEQEYQLKYFKSKEDMEKQCGRIELSQVCLLVPSPKDDHKWPWIQKTFNCSPSHVLFIKTNERGFFLIGEDSKEMDIWFSKLFDAMEKRPHRVMGSEDICSGQAKLEVSLKDLALKRTSTTTAEKQDLKMRSLSDPSSNAVDHDDKKAKGEDSSKRPVSGPLNAVYDYPGAYLKETQVRKYTTRRQSLDSLYESMLEITPNGKLAQAEDKEVGQPTSLPGSMLDSVNEAFRRLMKQVKSLDEAASKDREETRLGSDLSSSSSENIPTSPEDMLDAPNVHTLDKQSSTESLDNGERDIDVKRADLKKHLSITEVYGKPCVSGWTGQPQSVFLKGDQILAINDLHAGSVEEFNMYLSKSLKSEVKVTILRLHGCLPLHSPICLCSD